MRALPPGWECNLTTCRHRDSIGSEHSCRGGSLEECPIARGFISDEDFEALKVGRLALRDDQRLTATQAYFDGRRRGTSIKDGKAGFDATGTISGVAP